MNFSYKIRLSSQTPDDLIYAAFFFIDIVGLSNPILSTETQRTKIKILNETIYDCKTFLGCSKEDILILPTGDGMLLGFKNGLEEPLKLAIEFHEKLSYYNKKAISSEKIETRIGCNTGQVFEIKDVYGNINLWGPGVIIARRMMDLGEPGHILMSSMMAERLYELSDDYKKIIHPLHDYTIKHRDVILLHSVYGNNFGNPNNPRLEMTKSIDQSTHIYKLRKNIFYDSLEYNLRLKNFETNFLKILRVYSIENYFKEPIYDAINGITTSIPKTFSELNVKLLDESDKEITLKSINIDSPLRKEFTIKFNKPVYKGDKNRKYSVIYEAEEPYPTYEHFFWINTKKLTVNFSYPSNCGLKNLKLYYISRENREKKLVENDPQIKQGLLTQVTWKFQHEIFEKDIIKLEWSK